MQLLEYFGKDRSHTSWIGSLMNAFFMLAGKCKMHDSFFDFLSSVWHRPPLILPYDKLNEFVYFVFSLAFE